MNIEYKDYLIKQSTNSNGFDLVRKVTRNKKDKDTGENTGETYDSETTIGYDMSLERCAQYIIMEELNKEKVTVKIDEFLKAYKAEKEELVKTIKLD